MFKKEQLFEAKRLLLLYKIQLKISHAYNKIYLVKFKNIIRDISLGFDKEEELKSLKKKAFGDNFDNIENKTEEKK